MEGDKWKKCAFCFQGSLLVRVTNCLGKSLALGKAPRILPRTGKYKREKLEDQLRAAKLCLPSITWGGFSLEPAGLGPEKPNPEARHI